MPDTGTLPEGALITFYTADQLKKIDFDYFVSDYAKPSQADINTSRESYWFNVGLDIVFKLENIFVKKAKTLGKYAVPAYSRKSTTKDWYWVYCPTAKRLAIEKESGEICGEVVGYEEAALPFEDALLEFEEQE